LTALEDKLSRYKDPSSATEKEKQDRAERMVRDATKGWSGFEEINLEYLVKGSYPNNTNVRFDSDVDIAVLHGGFHYYDDSALRPADKLTGTGVSISHYDGLNFRREMEKPLEAKFGSDCDTTGKTAITITENSSRVSADVVPSFHHVAYYYDSFGRVASHMGTMTYRTDSSTVINYPEQQLANGRAKNTATGMRSKQMVRILKRVENDLVAAGTIKALPSYFMECLVYQVPNNCFGSSSSTPLTDDLTKVITNIWNETKPGGGGENWLEPNEIKPLFATSQPWTMVQANALALATWTSLGLS
jgi:hypothetical protein